MPSEEVSYGRPCSRWASPDSIEAGSLVSDRLQFIELFIKLFGAG
jgi:hypothetical protein